MEWEAVLIVDVYGDPKGQPRSRSRGNGRKGVYNPETADAWKRQVRIAAAGEWRRPPLPGPLKVSIVFYFNRPQRLNRKNSPEGLILYTAKPDNDNLEKSTWDALTDAGIWKDDAIISANNTEKFYSIKGGRSGALIQVFRVKKEPSGAEGVIDKGTLPQKAKRAQAVKEVTVDRRKERPHAAAGRTRGDDLATRKRKAT